LHRITEPLAPGQRDGPDEQVQQAPRPAHVNPHAFRHTMASILCFNSADSVSISKRLGHAQVSAAVNICAHVIAAAGQKNTDIPADAFLKKA